MHAENSVSMVALISRLPAAQPLQAPAPTPLYAPESQRVQDSEEISEYLPPAQDEQNIDEAPLYLPCRQSMQASASMEVVEFVRCFPAMQAVHELEPIPLYSPDSHVVQSSLES